MAGGQAEQWPRRRSLSPRGPSQGDTSLLVPPELLGPVLPVAFHFKLKAAGVSALLGGSASGGPLRWQSLGFLGSGGQPPAAPDMSLLGQWREGHLLCANPRGRQKHPAQLPSKAPSPPVAQGPAPDFPAPRLWGFGADAPRRPCSLEGVGSEPWGGAAPTSATPRFLDGLP